MTKPYTYCDSCDSVWHTLTPTWHGSHNAWLERHRRCSWFQVGASHDAE